MTGVPERMTAAEARKALAKPARAKYRNQPVVIDGLRFDSKRESIRWHVLRLMEKAGDIKNLRRQPRYPLHAPNLCMIGAYVADFEYVDALSGQTITEDVKSDATEKIALFRWKQKHFEAQYGRKIRVTK